MFPELRSVHTGMGAVLPGSSLACAASKQEVFSTVLAGSSFCPAPTLPSHHPQFTFNQRAQLWP
jgi:hypothetical protein